MEAMTEILSSGLKTQAPENYVIRPLTSTGVATGYVSLCSLTVPDGKDFAFFIGWAYKVAVISETEKEVSLYHPPTGMSGTGDTVCFKAAKDGTTVTLYGKINGDSNSMNPTVIGAAY